MNYTRVLALLGSCCSSLFSSALRLALLLALHVARVTHVAIPAAIASRIAPTPTLYTPSTIANIHPPTYGRSTLDELGGAGLGPPPSPTPEAFGLGSGSGSGSGYGWVRVRVS